MNNKGTEQTAHMHRLVCVFVVRKPPKTGFLALRPIICPHCVDEKENSVDPDQIGFSEASQSESTLFKTG